MDGESEMMEVEVEDGMQEIPSLFILYRAEPHHPEPYIIPVHLQLSMFSMYSCSGMATGLSIPPH